MNKNFLHNRQQQKFPGIRKTDIIIGIALGLFAAFIFYSFLYLLREGLRMISLMDKYNIWILPDKEVHFYNLFFAFISVIFAQSVCFSWWFERPQKAFKPKIIRKISIVNDQRFMNSYFLSWFSKIAVVFFLGALSFSGFFYVFNLYPTYNYLFVLIPIVLFLQTWVTIGRIYKRKSLKWMLFSAIVLFVSAFGMSRINLIDYHSINAIYLDKNIFYKYNLELTEVNECTDGISRVIDDIYLVNKNIESAETKCQVVFNGKELSFDAFESELANYIDSTDYPLYAIFFRLYIDKSIEMQYVNRLKEVVADKEIRWVEYAVIPKVREYDKGFYRNYYSAWRLDNPKKYPDKISDDSTKYKMVTVCLSDKILRIDGAVCRADELYPKIKQQIEEYNNYRVKFAVSESTAFSAYIFALTEIRRAVNAVRNEYSMQNYSARFEDLKMDEREKIVDEIPFRFAEINHAE